MVLQHSSCFEIIAACRPRAYLVIVCLTVLPAPLTALPFTRAPQTYTVDGRKMNEFSMVFYNNLLSLPLLVVLILAFGEVPTLAKSGTLGSPFFQLAATLGGLLGFGISFTSMWFISNSTATFYSLTGSMNKILVVVVGMLLFNEPTNSQNLCSIALGLGAGVLLTFAKSRS